MCVEYALENNLSVRRNQLSVENNNIDLNQSRGNLLPSLNLNSSYGNRWGRSIDPTSNLFVTERITNFGFSGSSAVTLFSGFQLMNNIRQNEAMVEASRYDLNAAENSVVLDVVLRYLNVILNEELVNIAENQLNTTQAQVEQTRKLVDAGSVPISNLLDLEAQLASNELELINAVNNLNLAMLNLKQGMQLPASNEIKIEDPDIDQVETSLDFTVDEIMAIAMMTLPDVKSADTYLEAAEIGVKVAKGGYYPSLSLSGNMFSNYSGAANRARQIPTGDEMQVVRQIGFLTDNPTQTVSTLITQPVFNSDDDYTLNEQLGDNLSQSLGLNLSIPIFNGFRVRNNVQRARIARENQTINQEDIKNQIRQNIESAYYDAQAALKAFQASSKQVDALEESFRSISKRYNLGASNFVDYQISENNLFRARANLLRNKYEFLFRRKILDFYMGESLTF